MNFYHKLAIAIAGTALSSVLMETNPGQAAILSSDFSVDVDSGPLAGTLGFGSFSFDNSTLTGEGLESVGGDDLSISFDFLGNSYTELNEYDRTGDEGEYPLASFQDGKLLGLNFLVIDENSTSFAFSDDEIDNEFGTIGEAGGTTFVYNTAGSSWPPFEGQGVVTYSKPVPEPSSVLGTVAFGLVGTGLLLKRNMKKKAVNKTVTL